MDLFYFYIKMLMEKRDHTVFTMSRIYSESIYILYSYKVDVL